MFKIQKPERTNKILSTIALSVALLSPYYADAQSNYSYGGGGGGTDKCYKQTSKLCYYGGNFTITKTNCKKRSSGQLTFCTEKLCSGQVIIHAVNYACPD